MFFECRDSLSTGARRRTELINSNFSGIIVLRLFILEGWLCMNTFKENRIVFSSPFPVDVFIRNSTMESCVVPSHWHDFIEVIYILDGSAVYKVNDYCDNVRNDEIVLINSHDIHSIEYSPNADALVFQFLPDIIYSTNLSSIESKYILAFINSRYNRKYHLTDMVNNYKHISEILMNIYDEFINKKEGYEILIKGFIYQFIAYLVRDNLLNDSLVARNDENLNKLSPLLKYIENNFREEINLFDAANMLKFNYYYLSKLFKKTTGRNFKEYVDFVRIREVEKAITTTKTNISDAALNAGFVNVSSFNRVFKRIRNHTPSTYRKLKSENTL